MHRDPIIQARTPSLIADRWVERGQQQPRCHQLLIECLCYNCWQMEYDEPPLIKENAGVEVVEEEQVLIEVEEQQEEQQQEQQAYQLTPWYHVIGSSS
jgi:hypothetical protein